MKSQRVLAFLVLAVFPPTVLMACGGLFGKDADAGADAAVVVASTAEIPAAPVESTEPTPVESAAPAKVVVVTRDGGTKVVDAGTKVVDSGVPTPTPDAGKPVPTPTPGGLKIPSSWPSGLGSLKIPSGFPKLPTK